MTVVFVSAIYPIYGTSFPERTAGVWRRFAVLAKHFHIHLVCSAADADKIPTNVTPYFCEFHELDTYKLITKTTGLPQIRSETKDTKEFMVLMNAKTEFIKKISNKVEADHYVWLDAGLGHVFKDPDATYATVKPLFDAPLTNKKIMIPGCTADPEPRLDMLLTRVCWRFAGGFFIIPRRWIDLFYYSVLAACEEIRYKSGRATWEVNVWAYIESRIPIHWEYGSHDESIFNGIRNFQETALP